MAQGKSMFIVAGDYLYKELEKDYKTEMENIIAVKTPVISALGVKLDLCGAGAHEKDAPCAACNEKLRAVVKAVDEEKKKMCIRDSCLIPPILRRIKRLCISI